MNLYKGKKVSDLLKYFIPNLMSVIRVICLVLLFVIQYSEIMSVVQANQAMIVSEMNDSSQEDSETEKKSEYEEFDHNHTSLRFLLVQIEENVFSAAFFRYTEHAIGIYLPPPEFS